MASTKSQGRPRLRPKTWAQPNPLLTTSDRKGLCGGPTSKQLLTTCLLAALSFHRHGVVQTGEAFFPKEATPPLATTVSYFTVRYCHYCAQMQQCSMQKILLILLCSNQLFTNIKARPSAVTHVPNDCPVKTCSIEMDHTMVGWHCSEEATYRSSRIQ